MSDETKQAMTDRSLDAYEQFAVRQLATKKNPTIRLLAEELLRTVAEVRASRSYADEGAPVRALANAQFPSVLRVHLYADDVLVAETSDRDVWVSAFAVAASEPANG